MSVAVDTVMNVIYIHVYLLIGFSMCFFKSYFRDCLNRKTDIRGIQCEACGRSTGFVVIRIKWEVTTACNVAVCSFALLLFLITVFKHIDAFDPSWHKFKNFVMLEIMLLHLQPFKDSHLHLLIIVGLQPLRCCISRPNKYLLKGVILQHTLHLYTAHIRHKNCSSCVSGNLWTIHIIVWAAEATLCYGNKWKWLFVNGFGCKSLISTNVMKCLNVFQDRTEF
jgi:hypothetical protein